MNGETTHIGDFTVSRLWTESEHILIVRDGQGNESWRIGGAHSEVREVRDHVVVEQYRIH